MWLLLLSTVRHSLGRCSYIISDVCDMVLAYSESLDKHQLGQIRREVEIALNLQEAGWAFLGHKVDHDRWKRFCEELRKIEGSK